MPAEAQRKLRCAVYTRKSTEEGLELQFNSLEAQREACSAYITSQRHEGWSELPARYDDGGYSGGTLDRPAFQQLLADLKAGRIDVVVVYKVDRLTRSLADFAKIVEVLDRRGASFVSVTQAFNTTNSMGRLTLNVLLSFAQFEREVTGERIRDKIAASKAKGMWMGGNVPLGYRVRNRKLIVVESEAVVVRTVFATYLETGSMPSLIARLAELDLRTKVQHLKTGQQRGGVHFSQGALGCLLRNRVYRGEVSFAGQIYAGEHRAIVDADVWDAVQLQLDQAKADRKMQPRAIGPSLLAGLVVDEHGRPMTPTHTTNRHRQRYRYYITNPDKCGERQAWRMSAPPLERTVLERLCIYFDQQVAQSDGEVRQAWLGRLRSPHQQIVRQALLELVARIEVGQSHIRVVLKTGDELDADPTMIRAGKTMKLVMRAPQSEPRRDDKLIGLIARADSTRTRLLAGEALGDIAASQHCSKASVIRLARLGLLPSDVITAIVEGRQPSGLTRSRLWELTAIPFDWEGQRELLGFA